MTVVEPGPGFVLMSDGDNLAADASIDLVRVDPDPYVNHGTVASLIVRLTDVEDGWQIEGVGIELTRNDLLYLAREINLLYERLT